MRLALLVALCVAIAMPSVALADLEEGSYAPDIEADDWLNADEPVSLTHVRGMTVVLFFWVSWHPGGEAVIPYMNMLNSRMGRSQGVFIMAVTDSDRARVAEMLKEQKVFFPVAMESTSHEEYEIATFPRVVIIDANGKVQYSDWPGQLDTLFNKATEVSITTPPTKTHPEEARLAREHMRAARKALREDKLAEAFKSAGKAYDAALSGDDLKVECQHLLDLIESIGRDQFARANQAVDEQDLDLAASLLTDLTRELTHLDVSRLARRRIEVLRKQSDEFALLLEREGEAAEAEKKLAEAMKLLRTPDRDREEIGKAFEMFEEIIEVYPESDAAEKSELVLERMRANDEIMAHVGDHKAASECGMWLSQAKNYAQTSRRDRARELYRRIIDKYPETIWADIAAQRLRQMPYTRR